MLGSSPALVLFLAWSEAIGGVQQRRLECTQIGVHTRSQLERKRPNYRELGHNDLGKYETLREYLSFPEQT